MTPDDTAVTSSTDAKISLRGIRKAFDETVVLDNGQGGGKCQNNSPCRITYLFRTSFELTEIPDELIAEIMYDDAVKVYLNDVEVLLENITNPVDAATGADSKIAGAGEGVFLSFALDPADLVIGTNILAVEVHNSNNHNVATRTLPDDAGYYFIMDTTGPPPAGTVCTFTISNPGRRGNLYGMTGITGPNVSSVMTSIE